jgi:hypothetical protein
VVGADNRIALRYVTIGNPARSAVEVLSGLSAGERFVAAHGGRELAGKQVVN